jgi:Patatin-like phospholipase
MQRLAYSFHSPDQPRSAGGELPGQIVLVLQGGGALGSYQAGVYQALHEAGIAPDWIIGTSIGAVNAGLIAGNEPQCRLERLHEFWRRVQRVPHWSFRGPFPGFGERWLTYWTTLTQGIPGFFTPNPLAHAGDAFTAGRRPRRLLLDGAARTDACRTRKLRPDQSGKAAPDGRRRSCANQPDALFRHPRGKNRCQAHHGFGRSSARLSAFAHRLRTLLGRRHPFQHAH